ncbi:MAG: hypothetical protein AAGF26_00510 [Cyanobacteria bacterium P01_G01_bin.49]
MLKKLLGGDKKKEFFLEIDEAKDTLDSAAAKVEDIAKSVAETTQQKVEDITKSVAEATIVEEAPAKETKAKKSKKKSVKKAAKKEATKPQAAPAATNGQVAKKEEPTEVEFATKFFMVPTSRRRPGPSLNTFKNMARQAKVPRN